VIVHNSININKINNHISPQLIEHRKDQDDVGNTCPGLGRGQNW